MQKKMTRTWRASRSLGLELIRFWHDDIFRAQFPGQIGELMDFVELGEL